MKHITAMIVAGLITVLNLPVCDVRAQSAAEFDIVLANGRVMDPDRILMRFEISAFDNLPSGEGISADKDLRKRIGIT